jgi:signal transduction histidine kinase/serine phosphatase RsbU (regulator of sigma subunit)
MAVRADSLAGRGECGALARSLEWGATPLGPVEDWPVSLRTAAMTTLESRFGMCMFWGPELTMIYNDAYAPMLGAKHPGAMGTPLREVWPEIWDQIGPMLAGVMRDAEPTWQEDQLLILERNGFGEAGYFTYSFSPIRDEEGEIAGVFTAVAETTHRVVSMRRLEVLTRLGDRMAGAHTSDGVAHVAIGALGVEPEDVAFAALYLCGEDGEPRFTAMTGLPAGVPPEHWVDAARQAARGELELAVDEPGVETDRAVVLPVAGPGSERPAAALVLGASPHRPLDEDYRRFFRLIAQQLASALASAAGYEAERARGDALVELDRAKTEFFSNVSHEFRTPLTLMLGPLGDALEDAGADPEVQRERIAIAHRGALRLLRLVNTLLDFSRVEAGRAAVRFAPVDLAQAAVDASAVFRAAAERSGLELRVDVPQAAVTVDADPEMVEKILLNLVSNAFKYTLAGRVEIRVRPGDERAILEVSDTGVGIPADEQPRVFDRFHRIRGRGGRSDEGSGIGLALVRELVALHGGEIRVASRPGEGSTFRVELPRSQAGAALAPGAHDDTALERQRRAFREEALRWDSSWEVDLTPTESPEAELLVVDDNADLRTYLSRLLGSRYSVRTAVDGEDALARLGERSADLVISDVMMPRMDGFALLDRLRQDPRMRRTPVILLSARAGDEATVEGLGAGADDYLVKPFSAAELMARVQSNLELVRLRDALAAGERDRARDVEQIAVTLQRSLLPRALPDVEGAALAGRYEPAGRSLEVGGDFYDAVELADGRVVIAIGDVAGHGVLAAAMMGQLRHALRAYAIEGHRPAGLMGRLDRLVLESELDMTTCLCGIFDPVTGSLDFANAGHLPPLIRRADGGVERLEGGLSYPLGVAAGQDHAQASGRLAPGDVLLLYTDGLVERRGEVIDEGIDRLAGRLAAASGSPGDICRQVSAGLDPDAPDDIALLVLVHEPPVA